MGNSTHGFRINHPFLLTEGASSTGELFLVRRIGTLGGVPHATAASIAEGCIPQASGAGVVPVHDFTSAEDFWYFTLIKASDRPVLTLSCPFTGQSKRPWRIPTRPTCIWRPEGGQCGEAQRRNKSSFYHHAPYPRNSGA